MVKDVAHKIACAHRIKSCGLREKAINDEDKEF